MVHNLTIGTLVRRCGVNVETIHYYQRRGLLDEPLKPPGGFRQYPLEAVRRVRFIKRAKGLGFTLEEITGLNSRESPLVLNLRFARLRRRQTARSLRYCWLHPKPKETAYAISPGSPILPAEHC